MLQKFTKNLTEKTKLINSKVLEEDALLLTKDEVKQVKKLFQQKKQNNEPNMNRVTVYRDKKKFAVIQFEDPNFPGKMQRFVVIEQIGKGGSGKVKRMQNIKTGKFMALKIMNTELNSEEELLDREKEKDNLVRFGRSCGGFYQHADIKKDNGKLTNSKYFLAMDLAPGINLKKKFLKKETLRIYSNDNIFDISFDTLKDDDAKKYFLSALHVMPVKDQPDFLKVIYFVDGERKEKIFNKANFIDKCKWSSHLEPSNFSQMFSPEKRIIHIIQDLDNIKLFNELKQVMQLDEGDYSFNAKNLNELANISYLMVQEVKTLHQSGLLHRDIKPEQFMYDEDNKTLKLIDLGSAVSIDNPKANLLNGTTFLFSPPEVILQAKLNVNYAAQNALYKEYLNWKENGFKENFYGIPDTLNIKKGKSKNAETEEINIKTDIHSFSDFLKFLNQAVQIGTDSGNDLHLMAFFPKDNLELYKNSYILVEKKLKYVTFDGQYEDVNIKNIDKFLLKITKTDPNKSKLYLSNEEVKTLISSSSSHQPGNLLKRRLDFIYNGIINQNKNTEFSRATDIYALGLSIGQNFALTERKGISLAFNLKSPEYIAVDATELNNQILVIKSLEQARLNNIYGLNDEDLNSLIKMLQAMTAYLPEDRPTMEQVEQFFEKFSVKINNTADFSAQSAQSTSPSSSATTSSVKISSEVRKLAKCLVVKIMQCCQEKEYFLLATDAPAFKLIRALEDPTFLAGINTKDGAIDGLKKALLAIDMGDAKSSNKDLAVKKEIETLSEYISKYLANPAEMEIPSSVKIVNFILNGMSPDQKKTKSFENFSQEISKNPRLSHKALQVACKFVQEYLIQLNNIQLSEKSKSNKSEELKALRKQLDIDLGSCGEIGRCFNNSKVIGGKETATSAFNDFDTDLIRKIFMLNKIMDLEEELNINSSELSKENANVLAKTSTKKADFSAYTSTASQVKTQRETKEKVSDNPLKNSKNCDEMFEIIYNNHLQNGKVNDLFMNKIVNTWLPELGLSLSAIAFGLKENTNIKLFLTSDKLIGELRALERAEFIKNNVEVYVELRKNDHLNVADQSGVAEGAKIRNIMALSKAENFDSGKQAIFNKTLNEIFNSLKMILSHEKNDQSLKEKEQPAKEKEKTVKENDHFLNKKEESVKQSSIKEKEQNEVQPPFTSSFAKIYHVLNQKEPLVRQPRPKLEEIFPAKHAGITRESSTSPAPSVQQNPLVKKTPAIFEEKDSSKFSNTDKTDKKNETENKSPRTGSTRYTRPS